MPVEVIAVAGVAAKAANLAPFKHIAEQITTPEHIVYVDGAHNTHDNLEASSIAEQTEEIQARLIARPEKKFVILSQSLGAIAALNALEDNPSSNIEVISIAPPLTYPNEIMRLSIILNRLRIEKGRILLPSFSFADDASPALEVPLTTKPVTVPPTFFEELDTISATYAHRTRQALKTGKLHLVVPSNDWNTGLQAASSDMPNITYVKGPHSLYTDNETLQTNARIISGLV